MSTRQKISDWLGADRALAELGELRRRVAACEIKRDDQITRAKGAFVIDTVPLAERVDAIEAELKRFVVEHEPELEARSKKLEHGRVGLHLANTVAVRSVKKAVAWLLEARKLSYLRVKHELNKEVLREAPPEILKACGAKLKSEDLCYYEVDGARYQIEG